MRALTTQHLLLVVESGSIGNRLLLDHEAMAIVDELLLYHVVHVKLARHRALDLGFTVDGPSSFFAHLN